MKNDDLLIQIISKCSWLNLNILVRGDEYTNITQAIEKACNIWEKHRISHVEKTGVTNIKAINILELYNT